MENKLLTVAVPAYNAANYIEKCLDSFMAIKDNDAFGKLEIIVVNDGSTDNTKEIVGKYIVQAPDVIRIINKENGGHGSGINTGIKNANGKYFKIVDADDWLNSAKLADYINLLELLNVDLVASDFKCIEDESYKTLQIKNVVDDESLYGQTIDLDSTPVKKLIKMHSATYRTALLQEHFKPIDEHQFYVDAEYITYPVPYIKSVYFDRRYLYMYRLGRTGQSMDTAVLSKNRLKHRYVLEQLIKFYDEVTANMDLPEPKQQYLQRSVGDMVDNQFQIYISLGDQPGIKEELKDWDLNLKKNHPDIYAATSKKSISLLRKTDYRILKIGYLVLNLVKR